MNRPLPNEYPVDLSIWDQDTKVCKVYIWHRPKDLDGHKKRKKKKGIKRVLIVAGFEKRRSNVKLPKYQLF